MSLFQCDKCGVIENTALTDGYHVMFFTDSGKEVKEVIEASYRKVLGIGPDEKFGHYCSECCPIWFDENGDYGIGPNPNPTPGNGKWHGRFPKRYYPVGTMETDAYGNIREKKK